MACVSSRSHPKQRHSVTATQQYCRAGPGLLTVRKYRVVVVVVVSAGDNCDAYQSPQQQQQQHGSCGC